MSTFSSESDEQGDRDNLIYIINMMLEGQLQEESKSAVFEAAGLKECKSGCRKLLTSSTEGKGICDRCDK
jgi:hypothetical protein